MIKKFIEWVKSLFSKNTNITKRYMLTDFTIERWKGVDMKNVEEKVKEANERATISLYGKIGNPEVCDTQMKNISHCIKNIELINGKVYGDVTFLRRLKNGNGINAYWLIRNGHRFGIRAVGVTESNAIHIKKIYTWDIIQKDAIEIPNVNEENDNESKKTQPQKQEPKKQEPKKLVKPTDRKPDQNRPVKQNKPIEKKQEPKPAEKKQDTRKNKPYKKPHKKNDKIQNKSRTETKGKQ